MPSNIKVLVQVEVTQPDGSRFVVTKEAGNVVTGDNPRLYGADALRALVELTNSVRASIEYNYGTGRASGNVKYCPSCLGSPLEPFGDCINPYHKT